MKLLVIWTYTNVPFLSKHFRGLKFHYSRFFFSYFQNCGTPGEWDDKDLESKALLHSWAVLSYEQNRNAEHLEEDTEKMNKEANTKLLLQNFAKE